MKIFYATSVLGDIGGSEVYTRDLLKELIKRGHELCVFTPCRYDLKNAEMHFSPAWGHHAFHKFQAPLHYQMALRAAGKFKPDIVQSHSNSLMGWIGSRVRKKQKIPHVLLIESISSDNHNLHTKTIFEMEKMLLPKIDFDKIIVWTKLMKEKFLVPWGVKDEKIEVIPPAVNIDTWEFETNPSIITKKYGKNLVTTMKSLWSTSAKGVEYIIEAMPIVFERHPEYKYVIFGGGKEKENLEKKVQKMGLENKIIFHGYIQPSMWNSVAKATTVAPHSFVYELSISMSLMEYMARGVPCVVTDIGSTKEIVGDSALVVKPKNPKAIADGINRLIEDKELRKKLGKKAKALVKKKYSIKNTVDRLEEIYSKLVKKG
ncbi:MAG: glycosyltransferase family 4 protein [archaeon]|nr:glycosyltransferase family 4 protein [archaeon]